MVSGYQPSSICNYGDDQVDQTHLVILRSRTSRSSQDLRVSSAWSGMRSLNIWRRVSVVAGSLLACMPCLWSAVMHANSFMSWFQLSYLDRRVWARFAYVAKRAQSARRGQHLLGHAESALV